MLGRVTTFAGLMLTLAAADARAQIATTPLSSPDGTPPGWSFAIAPYVWLPTLSASLQATGPRGGTVASSISAGVGDYISSLNFGMMLGGEVRYGRFSLMTDIIYTNASLSSDVSHLSSVNLGAGPTYITREQQLASGTRLAATIWSLAGGYTLVDGAWGNLDAVAGLRMLNLGSTTNYQLTTDIRGANNTVALSRDGSLKIGRAYFNAIGGVTGRINIPDSNFYLPFYIDGGGGALPFTWQVYGGVAYKAAAWADVSIGYRYMAFQSGGSTAVHDLSLGGPILAANVHF